MQRAACVSYGPYRRQKTKDKRHKTKTRDKDTRQRQGPVWCCVARLGLLSFVSRLLRILAACLREQLPHFVHRVVDGDVDQVLADFLARRMRIAGESVVDARRGVRIVRPAASGAAAALRRFAAVARVARGLPLLRRL